MQSKTDFPDFDFMLKLHQEDPEALEAYRRHLLQDAVDHAPEAFRPNLENLLLQIEQARRDAGSPMEALAISFKMLHNSLNKLRATFEQAQYALAGLQTSLLISKVRH